VKWETETMHCR